MLISVYWYQGKYYGIFENKFEKKRKIKNLLEEEEELILKIIGQGKLVKMKDYCKHSEKLYEIFLEIGSRGYSWKEFLKDYNNFKEK